ncbi:hypothetical protein LTR10_014359 [Elasticomyces elasticus]|uniref:FAD-binding domain-containing protein n=1 Tax=Exophiala sideris TaxID=1016849 RepID=A0ABR0J0X2_9EURO|nr:hypothetical protein LTR10_014359 [Elasticomyces elasticus]KAK5023728.1 hypothetical protein LTS07_009236 [Exophiala sideris]KAK5029727.1 hypothetical protein LTR13_008647 [Exophiala sideris]KAK5053517.1 hypothetical protein LTR69_009475 [Exophiala sideris]KAK5179275.1 hypothetical protein LTR44_008429 [Eurotiomycetes sp. CCFEE 6388]
MTESEPSSLPPIAVIGGGLAGLTLSIGLSHNNIPHQIYESASAFAEIGAGIALGPNSVKALQLLDPAINDGFKKCVTYNDGVETDEDGNGLGPKSAEWMDIRVGMKDGFLDELLKLIPPSTAQFGKALRSIESAEDQDENLILHFADGTTAIASAVIACDGIKSVVRRSLLEDYPSHPASRPQPTNEYAYRGMFTNERFASLTKGHLSPGKGTIFCGDHGYIVMYPVEKGAFMNMVAIKREPDPSESAAVGSQSFTPSVKEEANWVQPVTTETVISDFADWGEPIQALLSQIERPERWALFDHLPAPTYVRGKVVVMGDAAHASTPHQGQGAGMAFEDSLVLSGVLGKILGPTRERAEVPISAINAKIEACFRAYDVVRRPRTQKLCKTSREMGEMIEFVAPEFGSDLTAIKDNLDQRMNWIWDVDLQAEIQRAVDNAKVILQDTESNFQ